MSREPRIRAALWKSSMPLLASSLLQLMLAWAATFFLGLYSTAEEVGIFNVAQRVAVLISFVLIAVNSISAPKFAALHRKGDLSGLNTAARGAAAVAMTAAAPVALIMLIAPGWLMSLFGQGFSGGSTVLAILAAGQYLNVATGSVGNLLMMCGFEKQMRNTLAAGAAANVGLCVVLIPGWGALGAAIATALGFVLQNGLAAYVAWKRLGFVNLPFANVKTQQ